MVRRRKDPGLPAPFLKRVWLDEEDILDRQAYPFVLPFLKDGFELRFEEPVTVIVGENGVGKSTLIEGIAAMCGYDAAGGGKGYAPVDHSQAAETGGEVLGDVLRGAWRPKITSGWFFRAESFYSVARYLDEVGSPSADFLSHSHGEGFMRVFAERCQRPGIYFFDEPESALSPNRQIEFLKLLRTMHLSQKSQVIMATHSPMLMALPEARLLRMTRRTLAPVALKDTEHFRLWNEFCASPDIFIEAHVGD